MFSMDISAAIVPKEAALQKALAFLSSKDGNAVVETFSVLNKADMYKVVTVDGWCLLSSETGVTPVLAYSLTDDFPSVDNMPDAMKWLFSYYEKTIAYAKEHSEETNLNAWADERNDITSANREVIYLSRLGNVEWGQSGNNNGGDLACERIYNKFCPDFHSVSCYRTIAGCGAVALGQVLWYYQWPYGALIPKEMLNDSGEVSSEQECKIYNWNLMPEAITSSTPMNQVDIIASFLRDCGYAEHMEYGNEVSNTYSTNIRDALKNYFGYTSATHISRISYPISWTNKIKNELRNGRPVIYRGGNNVTGDGHFFILHGFSDNHFNINWGWKGYCNHTLYRLDSLYVIDTHFNDSHHAIINITPTYPSCTPLVIPSAEMWSTNFLVQNGGEISVGNRTVTSGMHGAVLSGESVTLTSGFQIEAGAEVYIGIRDMHCDDDRGEISVDEDMPVIHYAPQKQSTIATSLATKILRDGHILILRGDRTYTITGQMVE